MAESKPIAQEELIRLLQDEAMKLPDCNVAISGMAGRFPKSDSVNEFETNLREARDMVNDQDNARFTCALWGLPPRAGRLKDLTKFDSEFFGYTQLEANYIDYQLRLLYEVVYESILDAGINPASLRGTNTGVFLGFHCNEFENVMADDPSFKSNGYYGQFAVKVAQYFDLHGMTVTFDAACASGFVALHNGIEAIRLGSCDQAIVCSSNIPIHPTGSFIFLQMQMLSPTGYSRFLDSRADGYVKSESCVSVFLQKKDISRRNYASVMASNTSVDGYKKEGITFPSAPSQEKLIRETRDLAGLSNNNIEYLEAHGTGTPAGDPQEARAITNVYFPLVRRHNTKSAAKHAEIMDGNSSGDDDTSSGVESAEEGKSNEEDKPEVVLNGEKEEIYPEIGNHSKIQDVIDEVEVPVGHEDERIIGPLLVGSVKTNMGHSEAASGLCAMIKVALMLENEIIYPGLHYDKPNSNIPALVDGRLKFVRDTQKLNAKIVPLSCYGFGGANVHVILRANEEPIITRDEIDDVRGTDSPRLVVMFGRSEDSVNTFFDQLINQDGSYQNKNCLTDDFLYLIDSINQSKIDRLMNHRGFMIVDRKPLGVANGQEVYRCIQRCELPHDGSRAHFQEAVEKGCYLMFPGLGCQWRGMASGLQKFDQFWSTIQRLKQILVPFEPEVDLISYLIRDDDDSMDTLTNKFCAIIAYEIALVNIVRDQLKVGKILKIFGHSLGEITAAYAAGLFDEREAMVVTFRIAQTLEANRESIAGKMVALPMSNQEATKLIADTETVQVCCINGPDWVTISGCTSEMEKLCRKLEQNGQYFVIVDDSMALHNEKIMNLDVRAQLKSSLLKVLHPLSDFNRAKTNWVASSVEGRTTDQADADYFATAMCRPVDFLTVVEKLDNGTIGLELAPSGLFESLLRSLNLDDFEYVKMMKQGTLADQQTIFMLKSIGQIYQNGISIDLDNFYHGGKQRPVRMSRRQTPSLSSIFKWTHEEEYFVPRYPLQFSKSSAKSEMPIDLLHERDKYLGGHCIEGRCLFPATGYLFIIWRIFSFTKRKIYDSCFQDVENELVAVEFFNVRLMRAVILGNRSVQFYMHFEDSTGRFEVREGGSVVVEGWARIPVEKPDGLLYDGIRDSIKAEGLKPEMYTEDIYRQFRVSGYDYGETFQCIREASGDGRYCKVEFNGHFVSLTDSILQSIFLAVTQYAPSGGLFLPTRIEYVRFQPAIILAKMREANMKFDNADGSLNTAYKRELMTKIMERESHNFSGTQILAEEEAEKKDEEKKDEEKPKCYFDTYCDPVTGVIVTDGIEMRGIKASPAPRRVDHNEILLESQQFILDDEEPVQDENLTKFDSVNAEYTRICDSISINILKMLCEKRGRTVKEVDSMIQGQKLASEEEIEMYIKRHLICSARKDQEKTEKDANEKDTKEEDGKIFEDAYDISKNGDKMLLSILDQLVQEQCWTLHGEQQRIRETVKENRLHLMRDLIQSAYMIERVMRPIMETVIENTCQRKMKLNLLELNVDDGIMRDPLVNLIKRVEPSLSLNYQLAHPDIERLTTNKLLPVSSNEVKTHPMKDIQNLFTERSLKDFDLIVYKDISCYSLPKQVIEKNGLAPVMDSLKTGIKPGGFLVLVMRQRLTLAERILLALSEPELIGLGRKDLDQLIEKGSKSSAVAKVNDINSILESRCKLVIEEATRNHLICIARKSDPNGCLVILLKNPELTDKRETKSVEEEKLLLKVTHQNKHEIESWLTRLKENFKVEEEKEQPNSGTNEQPTQGSEVKRKKPKTVWLCAVASKNEPINGLIGMMQALRKELGASYLRCFYDQFTFKESEKLITEEMIGNSKYFQLAVSRDLLWNCVDEQGRLGSYRHITINDYLSYTNYLCSNQSANNCTTEEAKPAYVNNAARGDLSSFTWFEAPFRYLGDEERKNLVRVVYSALNFRDIMLATGRLPLDAIPVRLAMCDCLLGLEFSGYDHENRRVMGMVFGRGIASEVICPERSSIKIEIPDGLDMKEAATIPVVYATAIMALIYRGKMKSGESILIQAGSGGVGQAAIRLALHFGLEVFTTVGTDEKRKFLLDEFGGIPGNCLKPENIFSSRDCSFEGKILKATSGRGVDLILNSLADDKLQASLRCLADGGRFLEIGKYDMSTDAHIELLALGHNKTFHGILLDKLFDTDDIGIAFRKQLKCVVKTMRDGLEKGYVKPIKYTLFKRDHIEEAFRFMATGKHVGKILIDINSKSEASIDKLPALRCIPRFQLNGNKSYIVTGGLGGLGLELTKWLISQGARHVVLTSRSGIKTGYQRITLRRLESKGAKFTIVTHDTTTRDGVKKLLDLAIEDAPSKEIGAIFHLAMVLKDTMLENMTCDDFEQVCRPKVKTCEHLDSILSNELKHIELDYFVVFSSVTSGKGNAGQANYAYANSCIERICERRRSRGQHGLAIQWGAIGDVGIAYENLGGNSVIVGGTIPQRMPSCQATLSKLLCSPFSVCLSVLSVNRGEGGPNQKGDLVSAIFHVLGIKDSSKVSDAATLGELGLDSLMAVEIRQYIEREYDMTLNMQEIRALTIGKIKEIGESGNNMKAAAANLRQVNMQDQIGATREVGSYGKQAGLLNGQDRLANGAITGAKFDKNFVGTFKPELRLPRRRFCLLNREISHKLNGNSSGISKGKSNGTSNELANGKVNGTTNGITNGRPIFFVPPIHGSFKQLEPVCRLIKRPCIGLNWTRHLGRTSSVQEAVECYIECLRNFDWSKYEEGESQDRAVRVVDLVGYSFGATIAFELMLALYRKKSKRNGHGQLVPGRLILLDGSPRQIELGSQLLSSMEGAHSQRSREVDELLMVYIMAHTRQIPGIDYFEMRQDLSRTAIEEKLPLASKLLCNLLGLNGGKTTLSGLAGRDGKESELSSEDETELDVHGEVCHAMEAFCRRYEHIDRYKVNRSLPGDCTLIRAEKMYMKSGDQKYQDDLDLSSVVTGKVELFIMAGDHESFLCNNQTEVARIISAN